MAIPLIGRTFKTVLLGDHPADKLLSIFVDPFKYRDNIVSIVYRMEDELKRVLEGQLSTLKKMNTYIQDFPDGKEHGEFLGVHFDYGVINMAGLKVDGLRTLEAFHESIVVPEEERLLRGTERVLFVSKSLKQFSKRLRHLEVPDVGPVWNLGVNYGYLKETSRFGLKSLRAGSWPDEYNFTGKPVRMQNLFKEIHMAADKIGLEVSIKGFIHTPDAVFLRGIWKYPHTVGSLSLSTMDDRCATCFKARTNEVRKISNKDDEKQYILLKIYWNNFGANGELGEFINDFDRTIYNQHGKDSSFEHFVAEKYIIQVVRIVLLQLADDGIIFKYNKNNTTRLRKYIQEETHGISVMSRSYSRGMGDQFCRTFRLDSLSVEDTFSLRRVVEVLSWRASFLLAMLIAVYLKNASSPGSESVFVINGTHVDDEIHIISSAVDYIIEYYGNLIKTNGMVKFTTQSQVFGAAVLAAIYTKDPFDYDNDYQDV